MTHMEIDGQIFEIGELVRLDNKKYKNYGRGKIVSFLRKWVQVRPLGRHKKDEKLKPQQIRKWKSAEVARLGH